LLNRVSQFDANARRTGGSLSVQGTGQTSIRQAGNPSSSAADEIQRLASRGNLRDEMGNTAQRQLAKAILPADRRNTRNRLVQAETQRNTAITTTGEATTK